MNPYPDRIEELHSFLASVYGQRDRQATEILLTALLPRELTGMMRPWFIIETDYPSRDVTSAWFSFGGEVEVASMAIPRILRYKPSEILIREWISRRPQGLTGLFVEAEWRRLTGLRKGNTLEFRAGYMTFQSMCLRVRVAHPKTDYAIRLDRDRDKSELARLLRRVLDLDSRSRQRIDPAVPPGLFYWCELLQKVQPVLNDWEIMTSGLVAVARGISILYADGRPPDWLAVDRVMRDCINYTTFSILTAAQAHDPDGISYADVWSSDAYGDQVTREVRRLNKEGVLLVRKVRRGQGLRGGFKVGSGQPYRYRLASREWREMIDRGKPILV